MNTSLSKTSLPAVLMISSAVLLLLVLATIPEIAHAASTGLSATGQEAGLSGGPGVSVLIGNLINAALSMVGVVFLVLMIYSGFMWMTAGGSEEKIGKAKKLMVSAVVGLVIIFTSYQVTETVINAVTNSATSQEASAP